MTFGKKKTYKLTMIKKRRNLFQKTQTIHTAITAPTIEIAAQKAQNQYKGFLAHERYDNFTFNKQPILS